MENKPNIIAKSIEEFKEIETELNKLPEIVYSGIESACKSIVGIKCTIRYEYKTEQVIYLPNDVKNIKDFDNTIGVYTKTIYFEIPSNLKECKLEYVFVPYKTEDIKPGIS